VHKFCTCRNRQVARQTTCGNGRVAVLGVVAKMCLAYSKSKGFKANLDESGDDVDVDDINAGGNDDDGDAPPSSPPP